MRRVALGPARGPGTPSWQHKGDEWRAAVDRIDVARVPLTSDLASVLETEDPEDSLTLWHLLDHADERARNLVLERLLALAPPPQGVSTAAIENGDHAALDRWRESFAWSW